MIKVQMRQKDVGDVAAVKALLGQALVERRVAVKMKVAKKLGVLLASDAGIDERQAIAIFYQEAAHGPGTKVLGVGRIGPLPKCLRNHAKHGAAVELKKAGVNGIQLHFLRLDRKNSVSRSPQSSASTPVLSFVLGCSWPPMLRNPRFSSLAP